MHVRLLHKRLALDFARFLIALLGTQCVGQQPSGLRLSGVIAAGQRKCLTTANLSLMRIVLGQP